MGETVRRIVSGLGVGALSAALASSALAQAATASVSGTVADETGGVAPGVVVTIINKATTFQRQTETSANGAFVIALLPPGRYTLSAELAGFNTVEVRDLTLNVGDQLVVNLTLQIAKVGETVTVHIEPSRLTTSPSVGTVVDRQFVENMPLNGRSFQSLIALTPGTVTTIASEQSQGQFSINGQRANANYFMVDGVSANIGVAQSVALQQSGGTLPQLSASGGTNSMVSIDALQEFRIETSSYAAEFGRTPGGQISLVTRSGTNDLHGAFSEYFRDDALDANDWFANNRGLAKPELRQHDFGGVVGGPVQRDHTFFFFSYEGLRLRQPAVGITDVPSLARRQSAPPAMQPFLNAFPLPNGGDRQVDGVSNGLAEFAASHTNKTWLNASSIRVDHRIGQRLSVFARYNHAPSGVDQRRGQFNGSLNQIAELRYETDTLTVGGTHTLTPRLLHDTRINYSRARSANINRLDDFGGATPLSISAILPSSVSQTAESVFNLTLTTGGASTSTRLSLGPPQDNQLIHWNVVDSLSLVMGSHALKFGVDYRWLAPTHGPPPYRQNVTFTSPAQLFAGTGATANVSSLRGGTLVFSNFSAYAQDVWHATPRLSLTYGVRWEVNPAPHERDGNDPFAVTGFDTPSAIALAPQGTALYGTTYGNFAPRLGAAYQVSPRRGRETVLRTGFGVFYDTGNAIAGNTTFGFPFSGTRAVAATIFPLAADQAAPPTISLAPAASDTMYAFDPDLELPYTYQWNVSLEQSLGEPHTVSVSYVGAVGRRLVRIDSFPNVNARVPGNLFLVRNVGTSDYHSFQAQFQRRLFHGVQGLASYTWSHAMDDGSNDVSSRIGGRRGPSDFDVRHVFSGAVTYNIPAGRNVAGSVLRDWAIDGIVTARSAFPIDLCAGSLVLPNGDSVCIRPNVVPGAPYYVDDRNLPGGRQLNRAAFVSPTAGQLGNLGRNALRGFGMWQADVAVRRQFRLPSGLSLQLRLESFNVFNHPNFSDSPSTFSRITTASLFGQATAMLGRGLGSGGAGLSPLYQVGGPRSTQVSLRVSF